MTEKTEFVLTAKDETQQAFNSVNAGLSKLSGSSVNLVESFKNIAMASVGIAGIGSLAALTGKITSAVEAMAGLKEAAEKTGASVENLGALKGVAKIGGRDFDAIQGVIVKLNKALHGTDDESKGAGKAIAALGLDLQALRTMDPAEAFVEIARAQEKFADGGGKTAALMAILGKTAAEQIPYMHDLAEQHKLIGKVTTEQAKAADEYEKNVVRLTASWGALSRQLAAAAVGPMKDVTDWMLKAQKEGGVLYGVLIGIGVAMNKALGGEINPAKLADDQANKAFTAVADLRKSVEKTQADLDAGNVGFLGKGFSERRLASLKAELSAAERELKGAVKRRDKIVNEAVEADKPKDTSLNSQTFGTAPKDGKGSSAATLSDYDRILKSLSEQIAIKEIDLQSTDALTASQKEAVKIMVEIRDGTIKTTAAERASLAGKLEKLLTIEKEIAAMDRENKAMDESQQKLATHLDALDEEARKLEKQGELYGLTEAQISAITQARLVEELAIAKSISGNEEQIAVLERELAVRGRITDALSVIDNKKADAALEAQKSQFDLFAENAAKGMQKSFADFLFDPFQNGTKGMLQSFGETIKRMVAEAVAADLTRKLFGSLAEGGKGDGLLSGAMDWLGGLFKNADGGVYNSPGLSAYSGSIVSQPTVFPFAKGIGLMGEAGAEAILPLRRGADGKLGVAAQNSGGGHTINVYVTGNSAPDVRRAAGQGAREAMAAISGAGRYR